MAVSAAFPAVSENSQKWNLGWTYRRIIEELADAFLPDEGRTDSNKQHVVRFVDGYMPHLPVLFRKTFPLGLLLLQWGSIVTLTAVRPFTLMGKRVRQRYLHKWAKSRFPLFRALLQGVRGLVMSAYYSLPSVHKEIDYTPQKHVDECIRRRAELLETVGEVDDHTASMMLKNIGRGPADADY